MRSRSPAGIPRLYVQVMDEGNSLARGQAGGDPSSTSWLDILATLMTGSRVRQWTNGGINGASTSQLISSDYSYFNDEKAKAIAGFYKVGILWEFTNDLAEIGHLFGGQTTRRSGLAAHSDRQRLLAESAPPPRLFFSLRLENRF